jgi:hypothetical protein
MPPVFHDPVAEPRCAAGGRSSNIISVRRERPSSIVLKRSCDGGQQPRSGASGSL